MSSEGEVTCPLCMEVMDLTDQQFKPCECGYELCVWCWHHIIEMAEKDETPGCCPACRNPYDKDKILGMTISSERLAELNFGKKQKLKNKCKDVRLEKLNSEEQKLQKTKSEILESRNDLSTVRVIQRNVVYIANVPIDLAKEEIFRKKEFLGQYGKVKRIIISNAAVDNQRFQSTRVVFVTFSKEEEALRCIQSVNGYILNGCPLKVCFGATKYCSAWLRNTRCVNPDCFYLHKVGSQEDTCTKDELTSVCASKLQQCSGISLNNVNRRSGSFLPQPIDYCCSSTNITTCQCLGHSVVHCPLVDSKNSLQNSDSRRSGARPVSTSCESRINFSNRDFQGTFDHPRVSSSSIISSTGMEPHISAQPWDANQSYKQIVSSNKGMPLSNGHLTNFASSKSYVGNSCPGNYIRPNFMASVETNIVIKDTVDEQKTLPYSSDSNGYNQLLSAPFRNDSIRCCTSSKTRETSSCWHSRCLDSISDGFSSAIEYPTTSNQDTTMPNLQAKALGPLLKAASSENVPISSQMSRGCSNLKLTESASKSEAKTNSLSCYKKSHGGFSTSISDDAIMGHRVSECSTYSAVSIGISPKEGQKMLHPESSGCVMRDLERQYMKSCSENSIPLEKDMVQTSGGLDKVNGAPREGSTNKAIVDSKVDSIVSDILSPDLGMIDLIEPHRLAKMFCDAKKKHECSKRSNAGMLSDSNEYSSFARMNNSDHAGGYLSSLTSDLLDPWKNSCQLDSGGKKTFDSNKSLLGLTVCDLYSSDVFNSKHNPTAIKVANEPQLTSSLHHSVSAASPVSRIEVRPLPSYPPQNIAASCPGFYPRHAADQDRLRSVPTYSGSTDQYRFHEKPPHVNSSQKFSRSNNYADFHHRGKLALSATHLNFPNNGSNLGSSTETDSRRHPWSAFGNLTQNSMISADQSTEELVKNNAMREAMKNYYGHRESRNMGSNTIGRLSGHPGTAISSDGIRGSQQEFPRPFLEHEEPKFEAPSFSYFHHSQYDRS